MLIEEIQTVSRCLPGLIEKLNEKTLLEWESSSPRELADVLKMHSDPGFLVPAELGGSGYSIVDMLQVLKVVGSHCPSLALMMTMHHHSVAAISIAGDALESRNSLLSAIAKDKLIMSSAFAEAVPGADVLQSSVTCAKTDDGYIINGNKKPCTMASVSDLILIGVSSAHSTNPNYRGVAIIFRGTNGLSVEPFWKADILKNADSNRVNFDSVNVHQSQVLICEEGIENELEIGGSVQQAEITALTVFQTMVSASYLGVVYRLASSAYLKDTGLSNELARLSCLLDSSSMVLNYLGHGLSDPHCTAEGYDEVLFSKSLVARKSIEKNIIEASGLCMKLLGGNAFIGKEDIRYLFNVSQCIGFHPPGNDICNMVVNGVFSEMAKLEAGHGQ